MPPDTHASEHSAKARLQALLSRQQTAFREAPMPNLASRMADLKALSRLLDDNREAIIQAICADYGQRSRHETLLYEFTVVFDELRHARRHLKSWMRRQHRRVNPLLYASSRNTVLPQPLGVIGVIVPWNFPITLSLGPLVGILAAGNRAMVKMSERSPHLAELLTNISPQYLAEDTLSFIADSPSANSALGPIFSALPFDHLLFTGSTTTGRAVMRNAANNLTPVTLELGGKSPAIVSADFPLQRAVERIMHAKLINAGQICTSVDYVFVPREQVEDFIALARQHVARRYLEKPNVLSNDYTAIIDERAWQRLHNLLDDALNHGAQLINLASHSNEKHPDNTAQRKLAPHLLLNVNNDMQVMQQEIFGPLLPILAYDDPQEVIDFVAARPRPLAIYPFTHNKALRDRYIHQLLSGGVSVNQALLHVGQSDLPFGGVGASGMGHYHGHEGFNTFSKLRPIYQQGPIDSLRLLMPPYTNRTDRLLTWLMRLLR
ncbi:coniferyl aldehyde dehydrogenase [Halomonas halocynthiae]|uniref:coniferyl aldehyde dehydrogenase n=1 Tax=Halomonas halocynthiae TaxID=176290 RepID=UPI00040F77DB|nr:coniferyl aldehyde dehydrogenase [Halomonas halocynthiae]